jgi:hypothetical protein
MPLEAKFDVISNLKAAGQIILTTPANGSVSLCGSAYPFSASADFKPGFMRVIKLRREII